MIEAPPPDHGRRWRRYLFLAGLLLVSILGWHFGIRALAGHIQDADRADLLRMALVLLAGFWIRAWKWHYALGTGQQGVLLFFVAKTAGNWTPGRAGELAPLLLERHRNARVAAWIGLDRAIEIAFTLGLGLVGAAAIGLLPWWVVGLVVVVMSAAIPSGIVIHRRWPLQNADRNPSRREAGRIRRIAGRLYDELVLFGPKTPLILLSTAVAKVTDVYAVMVLCAAFGFDVSFLLVCAARCAHGLVSAIPVTPDATGIPFVAAAWLLHLYAEIPYAILTAALGLEVVVINAILWACFCLVSGLRWNTTPDGSPRP